MPDFFDYRQEIEKALIARGNQVFFYPSLPKSNLFLRVAKHLSSSYVEKKFEKYIDEIQNEQRRNHLDIIVCIFCGLYFKPDHLEKLKEGHPGVKTVYYAWDSVMNFPSIANLFPVFDYSLTFDDLDAKKYGVDCLPLYYDPKRICFSKEKTIDVSCIMTLSYGKLKSFERISSSLPDSLRSYYYFFFEHKSTYHWNNYKFKNCFTKYRPFIHFKPLSTEEAYEIFSTSKVVIDCPLPNQRGLTMRSIEALAMHTKLITTNSAIKEYDFYSPNNIFVIEPNTDHIPRSFFETPFDQKKSNMRKYSLDKFLDKLVGG